MRFQTYIYLASAMLIDNFISINGAFPGSTLPAGVASDSVVEYIGHSAMSGPAALYLRRNIIRPRSPAPVGVAHIVSLPAIFLGEAVSEDDIRASLRRSFALVRGCLLRQTNLMSVLISGTKTFDAIMNGAPEHLRDGVHALLTQVIHETFDDIEGKSILIDNMATFSSSAESVMAATYTQVNAIMGPEPLRRMGATTLIVTVAGDALSSELTPFIQGGLVATEDAPIVMIGNSAAASDTVVAEAEAPTTGLTEEEQAELEAFYAAESAAAAASLGFSEEDQAAIDAALGSFDAAAADAEPEVRPPMPALVSRLVGDDLEPFDPSTESDPELREALIASRAEYLAPRRPAQDDLSRGIAASLEGDIEDQLLAAAVEDSQRRIVNPVDIEAVIADWIVSTEDVSMLVARLISAGMEQTESQAIAAQLAADHRQ